MNEINKIRITAFEINPPKEFVKIAPEIFTPIFSKQRCEPYYPHTHTDNVTNDLYLFVE